MALNQRPAARFFAAFYRWNRHSQRSILCVRAARYGSSNARNHPTPSTSRSYHATRLCRQNEQTQFRSKEEAPIPTLDDSSSDKQAQIQELPQDYPPKSSVGGTSAREGNRVEEKAVQAVDGTLKTGLLKDNVRRLMRNIPTSVAVITAAYSDPETKRPAPLGLALSSLNTVTLDPPTISFNVRCPSKTWDAIQAANGLFRVHFLAAHTQGARIADLFTQGNDPKAMSARRKSADIYLPKSISELRATESLAPQIKDSSVVAAMECEITKAFPVADHVVAVARVETMQSRAELEPTLLYVDGKYLRKDGTVLRQHITHPSEPSKGTFSYWNYSLFPGEGERLQFKEQLKTYIKGNVRYLDLAPNESWRELQTAFEMSNGTFGINISQLIAQCRVEEGRDSGLQPWSQDFPVMYDFYGQLTLTNKTTIRDRAKAIIRKKPQLLSSHYEILLNHLSVDPSSTGLLASDILRTLRADGLVSPFDPDRFASSSATQSARNGRITPTLEYLEFIEYKLGKYLSGNDYDSTILLSNEELMEAIGERGWVKSYVKQIRSRIQVQCEKDSRFHSRKIEIRGDITSYEVNVIVERWIFFLTTDSHAELRGKLSMPVDEVLRLCRVDPTVAGGGFDANFLHGKLKRLYSQSKDFREFWSRIDDLLAPLFSRQLSWQDLESRAKQFVQAKPLHAMQWSRRAVLAAMGIDQRVKVKTPVSQTSEPLLTSYIIPVLFAKELKEYYGKGTEGEKKAIAEYLQEHYDYDVQCVTSEASGYSIDEWEAAVLQFHGPLTGDDTNKSRGQKKFIQKVPTRFRGAIRNQKWRKKQKMLSKEKGYAKEKLKRPEWKAYRIDGEEKPSI